MKEIVINRQNEGTKLLRMLAKLLPGAGQNFVYKMLRKKNITLNDKKATGNELLKDGDSIKVFFSDETYAKFAGTESIGDSGSNRSGTYLLTSGEGKKRTENNSVYEVLKTGDSFSGGCFRLGEEHIIYEDDDTILCNKPAGVLSQKASRDDISMVELIAGYLESKGEYDPEDAVGFKPAVANRLDRNTSGIIAAGKSVSGLKFLSDGFKARKFEKLYLCVVKGELKDCILMKGLWHKSGHGNRVRIQSIGESFFDKKATPTDITTFPKEYFVKGNIPVQTYAEPVISNGKATLCLVKLITGKTHQIRAQMAEAGYPLLGDHKYGDRSFNSFYKDVYGTEFQLLHAYMLDIPHKGMFFAELPGYFKELLAGEELWVEDLKYRIINN